MSNDSQTPNGGADLPAAAPQIEVLFAGDLAADDPLWVVRCSVEALHAMFVNPVAWVAALIDLPGWLILGTGDKAPVPVLTNDFAMVAERTETTDPDGWVLVQGISGTNVLTLVASRNAAIQSAQLDVGGGGDDPFAAFWKAVGSDPSNQPSGRKPYPVVVLEDQARWYGHFEIRDPVTTPAELARRIASFLLASLYDPAGYAAMLSGLDQKTVHVRKGSTAGNDPITIAPPASSPTTTFYANVVAPLGALDAAPLADGGDPPLPDPFACTMTAGSYSDGTGTNDGGTIKRYGVEDPPPPPPVP